VAGWKH